MTNLDSIFMNYGPRFMTLHRRGLKTIPKKKKCKKAKWLSEKALQIAGNPLQYSCLENPRDRGAQWAAVYGVAELDTTEAT